MCSSVPQTRVVSLFIHCGGHVKSKAQFRNTHALNSCLLEDQQRCDDWQFLMSRSTPVGGVTEELKQYQKTSCDEQSTRKWWQKN